MITIGTRLPDATLMETTEFGEACPLSPHPVPVAEATKGKRVVIFGLPGAYTPTCSAQHVPGFLRQLDAFKAKGVDEIWCVSVNDAFVMAAWGRDEQGIGKIRFLGDGSGDFATKLGLDMDLTGFGMGKRMQRCSMLVDDGVVKQLFVEQGGTFEVSSAEHMLKHL
jgi:peroxiredoxin